jgi:HK97 family phage major capsid protein
MKALELAREQRAAKMAEADAIIAAAEADTRDLTSDEFDKIKAAKAATADLDERIAELTDLAKRNAVAAEVLPTVGGARVTHEPSTYREDNTRDHSFITDAWNRQNDPAARERIERHMREVQVERRDIQSSTLNGLVPPLYVLDMAAELARGSRPFANVIPGYTLPDNGMTVFATRVTTGTSVDVQTELGAVSETDMVTTDITIPVVTITGQQDISRQAVERGQVTDRLVFADLFEAYAERLDLQLLNGSGAAGQHRGILNVAGVALQTFSTTSVTTFMSKLAGAMSDVATNRRRPATIVVMHPRRWHALLAASDGSNRPLVVPNALNPWNALAVGETGVGGVVGTIGGGIPVLVDANVPTTVSTDQDRVIVTRLSDHALWEAPGGPSLMTFEQSNAPGAIRLAIWGYSAFTAGRYPSSTSVIVGTGLVAPSF